MKPSLLSFLFLLLCLNAYSDDGRRSLSFKSKNGQYELSAIDGKRQKIISMPMAGSIMHDSLDWGIFQNGSKMPLYILKGDNISSKTVFVSNDGNEVAVIDDFSVAEPSDTLPVIHFYKSGSLIKMYRLNQLLCSSYNISESASHFTWLAKLDFYPLSNTLVLETFELNAITLNVVSGEIISKTLNPLVTKTCFLGFGKVRKLSANNYEITVSQRVYGKVPDNGRIAFHTKRNSIGDYETLLIEKGEEVEINKDVSSWILNQSSYQIEQKILQNPESKKSLSLNRAINTCL